MAVSRPNARAVLLLSALFLPALLPRALDAASPRALPRGTNTSRVLSIDAASSVIDLNTNHLVMSDVTISQGGMSIKAREAEAGGPELSFDGSSWEFRGDVRIRFDTGNLDAQNATVSFVGNRIARARARGTPATFEQKVKDTATRGQAGNIDYDVGAGRVTLSEDTRFTDGRSEIRTDLLVYSLSEQRLLSGGTARAAADPAGAAPQPTDGGRIHITIQPDEEPDAAAEPQEP